IDLRLLYDRVRALDLHLLEVLVFQRHPFAFFKLIPLPDLIRGNFFVIHLHHLLAFDRAEVRRSELLEANLLLTRRRIHRGADENQTEVDAPFPDSARHICRRTKFAFSSSCRRDLPALSAPSFWHSSFVPRPTTHRHLRSYQTCPRPCVSRSACRLCSAQ